MFWLFNKAVKLLMFQFPVQLVNVFIIVHKYILILDLIITVFASF